MFAGVAQAVKSQVGRQQEPSKWSTRMTQHSDPVECNDLLCGWCCTPCALAAAKSNADKTNPCFNFCCFTPCASYSWVRYQYGIAGVCGDDLCYGIMCSCCTARQAYTEARMRGPAPNTTSFGANSGEWAHSLFDCQFCDFVHICFCFCCITHDIRKGLQPQVDSCCYDTLCLVPCSMYGQVRHSYGIVTDFPLIEDFCLPLVCFLCAFNRARLQVKDVPLNRATGGGGGFLPAPGGYGRF